MSRSSREEQPELLPDPRPRELEASGTEEFMAVCARAERGELRIHSAARGKRNADWVFEVSYPPLREKR